MIKSKDVRQALEAKLDNENIQTYLGMLRQASANGGDADAYESFNRGEGRLGKDFDPRDWAEGVETAGAYNFTEKDYEAGIRSVGLKKFSAHDQDLLALLKLSESGSLDDIEAGDFGAALDKDNKVWEALPGHGETGNTASADSVATSLGVEMPEGPPPKEELPEGAVDFGDFAVSGNTARESQLVRRIADEGQSPEQKSRLLQLMQRLPEATNENLMEGEDELPTMLDDDLKRLIESV